MKCKHKYLLILILAISLSAQGMGDNNTADSTNKFQHTFWRPDDHWVAYDKMQHFTTSAYLFVTSYYYQNKYTEISSKNQIISSYGISLSFGIGKEILDLRSSRRYFSLKDLIVDVAGVAAGHIIVSAIK